MGSKSKGSPEAERGGVREQKRVVEEGAPRMAFPTVRHKRPTKAINPKGHREIQHTLRSACLRNKRVLRWI